jgi:hypothetical protein
VFEYVVLTTGQRYLLFSIAYYSAEETKPTLLYHGMEVLPVLSGALATAALSSHNVNDSNLSQDEVSEHAVNRTMALLAVCFTNGVNVSVPAGWAV